MIFNQAKIGDLISSKNNPNLPKILIVDRCDWLIKTIINNKLELIHDAHFMWNREVNLDSSDNDVSKYEWVKQCT